MIVLIYEPFIATCGGGFIQMTKVFDFFGPTFWTTKKKYQDPRLPKKKNMHQPHWKKKKKNIKLELFLLEI